MNENQGKKQSAVAKFLAGRGFYVALAVSVLGAGAAAWLAVDRTINGIQSIDPSISQSQYESYSGGGAQWELPSLEEAVKPDSDVEIPSSESLEPSSSSSSQPVSSEPSATSKEPAQPAASSSLLYVMPLSGEVIGPFSNHELVKSETLNEWRTHDGIDIAASPGAQVKAIAQGTVRSITNDPMWGTVIEIEHDGNVVSYYAGLNESASVAAGDSVKRGQVVGTLMESMMIESALGTHLHFGIQKDGQWVDPIETLKTKQ